MKGKQKTRKKRKMHIRKKLKGTSERPRGFVFRSNQYVYLGVANDDEGKVYFSLKGGKNRAAAVELAKNFAKKLKEKKIDKIVFDRGGYKYAGVVKVMVETLREEGIIV